jgi:hypothetical protein
MDEIAYSKTNPLLHAWHGDATVTGIAQWIFDYNSDRPLRAINHTILNSIKTIWFLVLRCDPVAISHPPPRSLDDS